MAMTKEEVEKEFYEIKHSEWERVGMPIFFITITVWLLFTAEIGWFYDLYRLDTMNDSVRYVFSSVLLLLVICSLLFKGYCTITHNIKIGEWKKRVHKEFIGQLEPAKIEPVEISVSRNYSLETIEASDIKIPVKIKEFHDGIFYDRVLYVKVVKEKFLERSYLSYQEFEGFENPNISDYISAGVYNLTLFIPEEEALAEDD